MKPETKMWEIARQVRNFRCYRIHKRGWVKAEFGCGDLAIDTASAKVRSSVRHVMIHCLDFEE